MGQTTVKKYNLFLRDLIIAGRAKPSFIVSRRIGLQEPPRRMSASTAESPESSKVLIKPAQEARAH